ncbi:hypothetical protein [Candidatus Pelagibacter sp. HIMB1483]|uniref:hypothetical protein n=1 Tax=Candidatus Pelagibacter sp. HIMB1483 TaxID=3415414 RepID=UPI003F85CB25
MYNVKYYSYNLFQNDFYLQNSLSLKTSILYPILKTLKINLSNDFIAFSIHLLFSAFNGFLIFKIIKNHFHITDIENILLVALVIISIDNFFIEANRGSWIISHTNCPTYFAKTFALLSVYLLLEKKIFYSILSLSFTLLMHIKVGWVLVPIFFLFLISEKDIRNKSFYIVLPLICALFLSTKEELVSSYEIRKNLFEIALDRDQIEGAFKFQPLYKNISLFVSFIVFYFLNKNETHLKKFNFVLLFISSSLFIFNIIYVEYLNKFIPDPRIIILGIPRALELYETFFWLLVLKKILSLKTLNNIKIFFITGLFFLLIYTIKSLLISLLIFIFCIFLYFLNNSDKLKKIIKINVFQTYVICLLMIFLSQSYLSIKKINNEIDTYTFSKTGKWTIQDLIKDNTFRLDSALEIKKCNDFILEDIDVSEKVTNYVANKSRLFGNVHYNYISSNFLNEHFKRNKLKTELYSNINNKKNLNEEVIQKLEFYKAVLLSTNITAELINYDNKIYLKNNDVLTVFDDQSFIELKKCLKVS